MKNSSCKFFEPEHEIQTLVMQKIVTTTSTVDSRLSTKRTRENLLVKFKQFPIPLGFSNPRDP
jgi:hypothetical protein